MGTCQEKGSGRIGAGAWVEKGVESLSAMETTQNRGQSSCRVQVSAGRICCEARAPREVGMEAGQRVLRPC